MLSYESNLQGSCLADGKFKDIPSPVRAATVWVRNGDAWQAAFHGEILIVDLNAPPAASLKAAPKQDQQAMPGTHAVDAPAAPANATIDPINDPLTSVLMAAENSVWDAWMKHDASSIENLTVANMAFVNLFGTFFSEKVAAIKDWTSSACEVTGFTLTNAVGTSVSPTIGILTLTGTVMGACGGQDISGQKIYATTVYVKEGDAWKWCSASIHQPELDGHELWNDHLSKVYAYASRIHSWSGSCREAHDWLHPVGPDRASLV